MVANAVDLQAQVAQAELGIQSPLQGDELRVDGRIHFADGLEVDLVEFAEAALLRLVIPERVQQHEQLDGLWSTGHAALQVGAHDAGGRLGPQRHAVAALVEKGVHLLLDDVGRRPDAAREHTSLFERRRLDLRVVGQAPLPPHLVGNQRPVRLLFGQDILGSARGLVHDPGMIGEAAPNADAYRSQAVRTSKNR